MELKITPSGQTIVKPTALGPVANTDTKLLIYGLFQKGRVLAQDAVGNGPCGSTLGDKLLDLGSPRFKRGGSATFLSLRWLNGWHRWSGLTGTPPSVAMPAGRV